MREAARLLGIAAALARGRPDRLPLVPDLTRSLEATGELRRAEEYLREVADDSGAAPSRFAFLEIASLRDYTDATAASFDALQAAAGTSDSDLAVRARNAILKAEISWTEGKYGGMDVSLRRARAFCGRLPAGSERRTLLNSVVGWEARAILLGPTDAKNGRVRCGQLLRAARGSHTAEAAVLAVRAGLQAMLGKFSQARQDYKRSRQIGEAFGLEAWLAALPLYSGPAELLAGRAAAAESQLRTGYDKLLGMGDRSRGATTAAFLAHALYEQHNDGEAERFARKSKALVADDDAFTQVVWRGALAKVLARRGDCHTAIRLAREAVDRAQTIRSPNLRGDALLDQAKVLRACGGTARAKATSAARWYGRKGNIVSEARAKAFVAGLHS
jgi:hypothetical protein